MLNTFVDIEHMFALLPLYIIVLFSLINEVSLNMYKVQTSHEFFNLHLSRYMLGLTLFNSCISLLSSDVMRQQGSVF